MITLVNYQAMFIYSFCLVGKNGAEQTAAVAQTVDGVRYDTRKAESLCSNKAAMFEDFYVELFEDAAGNYFTVLYQLSGCQHHTITPVSPYIAKQFWERFSRKVV